jgi:cytochrome b561
MNSSPDQNKQNGLDPFTRFIHPGLTFFGILAWLTGLLAPDYKTAHHVEFTIHKMLGVGLTIFILLRIWQGFFGPTEAQFRHRFPYTKDRLLLALEDILNLVRLKLPDRPAHVGLAGVVQTFGLAAFSWMAVTGSSMFFLLRPGHRARGILHSLKELHEIGWWLILVFLVIHVGAVTLHALAGRDLCRDMFFLKR